MQTAGPTPITHGTPAKSLFSAYISLLETICFHGSDSWTPLSHLKSISKQIPPINAGPSRNRFSQWNPAVTHFPRLVCPKSPLLPNAPLARDNLRLQPTKLDRAPAETMNLKTSKTNRNDPNKNREHFAIQQKH
ncbi:hypothetical protein U1Q18_040797 [Sarracenia purpurea var. burkii]